MTVSGRARAAFVLSIVLGSAVVTSAAAAAAPRTHGVAWKEMTDTDRGRRAAARAVELFRESGVNSSASDLRVLDVGEGDVLVLPSWARPEAISSGEVTRGERLLRAVEASLTVGLRRGHMAGGLDGQRADAGATVAAAPYWSQYDSHCFAFLRNGGSYMAPCYYMSKLMNDGSSTRDYFALRQRASLGTQRWGSANYDGWLMSVRKANTPAQRWEEWEPGGELRGNCGEVNLSVVVKGVALGITSTACERWEPTLWEDAGHFRNKWNCDCFTGVSGLRQVASNIAVSVAQGKYPVFTISAGFLGW